MVDHSKGGRYCPRCEELRQNRHRKHEAERRNLLVSCSVMLGLWLVVESVCLVIWTDAKWSDLGLLWLYFLSAGILIWEGWNRWRFEARVLAFVIAAATFGIPLVAVCLDRCCQVPWPSIFLYLGPFLILASTFLKPNHR